MIDWMHLNLWFFYGIVILGATALLHLLSQQLMAYLTVKAKRFNLVFGEAALKAMSLPLHLLYWVMALSLCCTMILDPKKYPLIVAPYLQIRKIAIIIILCWAVLRFIRRIETLYIQTSAQHHKVIDKTFVYALSRLATITVFILGLLIVMQMMNIPVAGLLTFGGIGGAGIAFASKELLANFFGGLIIYMDKPFKVGDWIRSPDKNIEGIVDYIGWRITRILTPDKRPLYVPNSVFLTISVENPSRMKFRRIKATIGIRYQDYHQIDLVSKQIREMLLQHKDIDSTQSLTVSLVEFAPSALNVMVSAFSKLTEWDQFQTVQHEILMNILSIVTLNGVKLAIPAPVFNQ